MTTIINTALLYNGDDSYTLQQPANGGRLLLLIATAFDWYGNNATLSCSVEGAALTPLASYIRAAESSNCNTAVYALNDAQLPAVAGAISVAFLSAYYSRLAIVELASAPQNTALLNLSNAAVIASAPSAAVTPAALDLVISALAINQNNTMTGLSPTTLIGVESSTGAETRFALGYYAANTSAPVTVGFAIEFAASQPGSLTTIRIPVVAEAWNITPADEDAASGISDARWLVGTEWFIAPDEDDALIVYNAPGWQQSDVGVTRNVVDPDGDPISSRISVAPVNGTVDLSLSGNVVYYPFDDESASDVFTVEPWSGGQPSPNTFQVTILHDETAVAPQFDSSPLLSVEEGSQYSYVGAVSDENGDAITVSALIKPSWATLTQTGPDSFTLVGTPPVEDVNTYQVRLRVGDAFLAGYQDYFITVQRAPFFSGANEVAWNNWGTGTLQLTSNTPGAVFTLVSPPAGISIDANGLVSGNLSAPGDVDFVARATFNGRQRDRVITAHVNGRPVFFNAQALNLDVPGAIEPITIEAQDPEGQPITLTQLQVPQGLAFVPVAQPQTTGNGEVYTGIFTGVLAAGTHTARVRAATASSGTTDFTFTITVAAVSVDLPPEVSADYGALVITIGEYFEFDASVNFSSPDNDPVVYSAQSLPPGLSINAATGAVSGWPSAVGQYNATIYCADPDLPQNQRVSALLPIQVQPAATGPKPVFNTVDILPVVRGQVTALTVDVNGAASVIIITDRADCGFDTDTRQLTINAVDLGAFDIVLRATNSNGSTDYTITVISTEEINVTHISGNVAIAVDYRNLTNPRCYVVRDGNVIHAKQLTTNAPLHFFALQSWDGQRNWFARANVGQDLTNAPLRCDLEKAMAWHGINPMQLRKGWGAAHYGPHMEDLAVISLSITGRNAVGQVVEITGTCTDANGNDQSAHLRWYNHGESWNHAAAFSVGPTYSFTPRALGYYPITVEYLDTHGRSVVRQMAIMVQGTPPVFGVQQFDEVFSHPALAAVDERQVRFGGAANAGHMAIINQGLWGGFEYFELTLLQADNAGKFGFGLTTELNGVIAGGRNDFALLSDGAGTLAIHTQEAVSDVVTVHLNGAAIDFQADDLQFSVDGTLAETQTLGFAVDFRDKTKLPIVHIIGYDQAAAAPKLLASITMRNAHGPVHPMVYCLATGNTVDGEFDAHFNGGILPFRYGADAVLMAAGVDTVGLVDGWGVDAI